MSNDYRPASLFPISANVFEEIIFHSLSEFLDTSKLLSNNQSGFHPGDSFVHHLFSITHGIYETFDEKSSLEVRGVFLDILECGMKI